MTTKMTLWHKPRRENNDDGLKQEDVVVELVKDIQW